MIGVPADKNSPRYHLSVNDLSVFILAGGKSSRMGKDKAFLHVGNESLLNRALQLAERIAENVYVVGDRDKFSGFDCAVVEDIYRDRGPLGGIHAALSTTNSDLNLVLAVDMPLVSGEFLAFLVNQARQSGATITVPNAGGNVQPLCTVYRKQFAAIAEQSLRAGNNKIDPLFQRVTCRIIVEHELTQAGFSTDMFRNVNTPDDLEAAQRLALGGNVNR
jgi:molybdopterin-guanine dinucleotide biosynthesis protein A